MSKRKKCEKNKTSVKRGQVLNPKGKGGRKKGSTAKPRDFVKLDLPAIDYFKRARSSSALQFEEMFREFWAMSRGELEKQLKIAREPNMDKNDNPKPLSAAAKKMPVGRVMVLKFLDQNLKPHGSDVDSTRLAFLHDILAGKISPQIESPTSMLVRLKKFIEGIKISGLDFDLSYADLVRFLLSTPDLSQHETDLILRVAKDLLSIELSNLEKIPRREVEKYFVFWSERFMEIFSPYPILTSRFQEAVKKDIKEFIPEASHLNIPLVSSILLKEKDVSDGIVTPAAMDKTNKVIKKSIKKSNIKKTVGKKAVKKKIKLKKKKR